MRAAEGVGPYESIPPPSSTSFRASVRTGVGIRFSRRPASTGMDGLPRRFAPRNDVQMGGGANAGRRGRRPLQGDAGVRSAARAAPSEAAPRGNSGDRPFNDCDRTCTMFDDRDDQPGPAPQVQRVGALFSLESKNRFSFRARSKRETVLDLRRSPLAYKPRNRVHPSGLAALGHLPLQGRLGETDCRAGLRTGAQ